MSRDACLLDASTTLFNFESKPVYIQNPPSMLAFFIGRILETRGKLDNRYSEQTPLEFDTLYELRAGHH